MGDAQKDEGNGAERLEERLQEASGLADEGRWHEAFSLLLEEEAAHPDDPVLLGMLGVAAREVGAEGAAYDFFRRCLAQEPSDALLLSTAGRGIAASDDPDAERVLRLAAVTAPELVVTRLNYGAYLLREGLLESAIPELEAARALDPEDVAVRIELAAAYLLAGRSAEALEELGEAVGAAAGDSWTQGLYGLALVEVGRTEEAVEELQAASAAEPEDWELQLAAALAAAAEGWADTAWEALARADLAEGADTALIREVESYLEGDADDARAFLREQIAAPMLRERLLART